MQHRVLIIGGGFGGLNAAKGLRKAPVKIALIDKRNFHLFQPLLYQVATGALSPANIAAPLRSIVRKQKNVQVLLGQAIDFDVKKKLVVLDDGDAIDYDSLILATGVRHNYFGKPEWEAIAPGLKTVEDATEIRKRILFAFEAAERSDQPDEIRAWLTFVIVGGGPTGVELAGALAEIAKYTLKHDFRTINPCDARILLVEASDVVLSNFPRDLAEKAQKSLLALGVEPIISSKVEEIAPDHVMVRSPSGLEKVLTRTVLWTAGVRASPLGEKLAAATGATLDRAGRVVVKSDFSVEGYPEVFVIGDLASSVGADGKPLPGLAPVAMQQGRYVAKLIAARLEGKTIAPFKYFDHGTMATVGRASAVVDLRGFHFAGLFAWLTWLFVHLMYIVQFHNRILVLVQWGWNYFTRNRAARLITGDEKKLPKI